MVDLGLCILVLGEAQPCVVVLSGWKLPVRIPLNVWEELVVGELGVGPSPRMGRTSWL